MCICVILYTKLQPYLIILYHHTVAHSTPVARGSFVDSIHTYCSLHYVCIPIFPPTLQREDDGDVGGRASILGYLSQAHSLLCLSVSLLTSTGNRTIRNVPIPQCPLKHLQMYSAPICHSWECGGVSSYVPTSTDGATPPLRGVSAPPEVTLLPYYSFLPSAWWIMMLLPYLVCCGNHAQASIAHSLAFRLCAVLLLIDLLATLVHLIPGQTLSEFPFKLITCFLVISDRKLSKSQVYKRKRPRK